MLAKIVVVMGEGGKTVPTGSAGRVADAELLVCEFWNRVAIAVVQMVFVLAPVCKRVNTAGLITPWNASMPEVGV